MPLHRRAQGRSLCDCLPARLRLFDQAGEERPIPRGAWDTALPDASAFCDRCPSLGSRLPECIGDEADTIVTVAACGLIHLGLVLIHGSRHRPKLSRRLLKQRPTYRRRFRRFQFCHRPSKGREDNHNERAPEEEKLRSSVRREIGHSGLPWASRHSIVFRWRFRQGAHRRIAQGRQPLLMRLPAAAEVMDGLDGLDGRSLVVHIGQNLAQLGFKAMERPLFCFQCAWVSPWQ